MSIPPPPEWIQKWAGLLGGAAVLGSLTFVWGWITKPHQQLVRRVKRLRRAFRHDSFRVRTQMTTIMGMAVKNENEIQAMTSILERIETSMRDNHDRVQERLDGVCSDIGEIKERLAHLEGRTGHGGS